MSNKTERQLKELRSLMPWNWDARVEQHPPGEKAMHDFENVINYQIEQRRRRTPQHPAPPPSINNPAAKHQAVEATAPAKGPVRKHATGPKAARLSPDTSVAPHGGAAAPGARKHTNSSSSSAAARPGKQISDDGGVQLHSLAVSTARNDATTHDSEEDGMVVGGGGGGQDGCTVRQSNLQTTTTTRGGGYATTPAINRKFSQTPSSRPSTARNHAAVADGQFQPTPGTTPTTVIGGTAPGSKNGTAAAAVASMSFRSPPPPPRTIFALKARGGGEEQQQQLGAAKTATSTAVAATTTTSLKTTTTTAPTHHLHHHQPGAGRPPVPTIRSKGVRTTATRPSQRPVDLSFLKDDDGEDEEEEEEHDASGLHAGNGLYKKQTPPPPHSHPSSSQHRQRVKRSRAPLDDLPVNLDRYGKGPVIQRPPIPLFKQKMRSPVPPPPPPSAQKLQAAAISGQQFYNQEKGLLALLSAGGMLAGQSGRGENRQPVVKTATTTSAMVPVLRPAVPHQHQQHLQLPHFVAGYYRGSAPAVMPVAAAGGGGGAPMPSFTFGAAAGVWPSMPSATTVPPPPPPPPPQQQQVYTATPSLGWAFTHLRQLQQQQHQQK